MSTTAVWPDTVKALWETALQGQGLDRLRAIVACLRTPEHGCPWDLKQTHASLRPFVLEEAYEVVSAIDALERAGNTFDTAPQMTALANELGDVLLQVLLHAQLGSEAGTFTLDTVMQLLGDKLVRRHPHVFVAKNSAIDSATAVTQQWEAIKQAEKVEQGLTEVSASILDGLGKDLPALMRTAKISQKAVKVGFAWPNVHALWACVMSEMAEIKAELPAEHTPDEAVNLPALEGEIGDALFALVTLANHYGLSAEVALHRATDKFTHRFAAMEANTEKSLADLSFAEWDALWKQAKQQTKAPTPEM